MLLAHRTYTLSKKKVCKMNAINQLKIVGNAMQG